MTKTMITVDRVSKSFVGHKALDAVSLEIPEGSIYGLLGPNGAGKTTLIRIINRITAPDSGEVFFNGHKLNGEDVFRIGYLPEERGLYRKMKVGEQAIYFARLKGLSRAEATIRLKQWFTRFEIQGWWNKKVEELSKGMAQKVQFIVTVLHNPKLLIFDEPFSGFDPINANLLKQEILRLRDEGATVIFSTHNMSSVEELCDNITLINSSKNILSGEVSEIRRRYGDNRYRVDFVGLQSDLESLPKELGSLNFDIAQDSAFQSAEVILADGKDVKSLISALNDKVEIKGFAQKIPSMNELFIRAVDGTL